MTLVAGEPAELIDPHWLFATYLTASERTPEQPVCRLPGDDPWMQNMLRPMVEAAGYRVVSDVDESEVDLAILSSASDSGTSAAARVIRLRSDPDPASLKDDTIYRYDRAALLSALKSTAGGRR